MKVSQKIIALVALLSIGSVANANLIDNGSFEDNNLNNNSWAFFASNDVESWTGSNIEIWRSLNGVDAFDGLNHAELNAHPATGDVFTIFQSFGTDIDGEYEFSFAYRARANNNEAFRIDIESGNNNVFSQVIDDHVVGSWNVFSSAFVATDVLSTISFTSITPATGTVGNFIDAVVVTPGDELAVVEASAPASIAMVVLGLSLLGARRFSK